ELLSSGLFQAEEPEVGKVAVGPALMIQPSPASAPFAAFSQDRAEPSAHPAVDGFHLAGVRLLEVAIPAAKDRIDLRHDDRQAVPVGSLSQGFETGFQLLTAFGPDESREAACAVS